MDGVIISAVGGGFLVAALSVIVDDGLMKDDL